MDDHKNFGISEDMQDCIDICLDCHRECLESLSYCLERGGKHAEVSHVRLFEDCAQSCQLTMDFLIRGSIAHGNICSVNVVVCDLTAESCSNFQDDAIMQDCADMCRTCADVCRAISPELLAA